MPQKEELKVNRVRDMIFADLYLGHPKLGNRFSEVPEAPTNPIVAGAELADDLERLLIACEHMHRQQQGVPDFRLEYDSATYRVAILQAVYGTVFVLRRMPAAIRSLQELGIPMIYARRLVQEGLTGLVLISGAMKSGKTTAAGAVVAERLLAYGGVAVTAEDPVEMPLEGTHGPGICFQTHADPNNGGFAGATRNLMRWGANIIFLGEIRDGEAAVEALRAGVNGHLVISTIHGTDVQVALRRIQTMASETFEPHTANELLADGLAMVVHMRLTGNAPRKLEVEMLTVRGSSSATAIIRQGGFERLGTEIRSQMVQMLNGRA